MKNRRNSIVKLNVKDRRSKEEPRKPKGNDNAKNKRDVNGKNKNDNAGRKFKYLMLTAYLSRW